MGGVLAVALLGFVWREDRPDGFHLFAAGNFFHVLVIEFVAGLFIARGADDGFGGVSEIAAGKIGRGIGFDPRDVVEELEAELLHGEADGMDDMAGSADPDGAVRFEDALAGCKPGAIELMNFVKPVPYRVKVSAGQVVPFACIDADHTSSVAGDAVVGEEVGRVGEDEVDAGFRDGGENVEAVALEDFDVVLGVVEDWFGEASAFAYATARQVGGGGGVGVGGWCCENRSGFGHGLGMNDDQVGSLIEW